MSFSSGDRSGTPSVRGPITDTGGAAKNWVLAAMVVPTRLDYRGTVLVTGAMGLIVLGFE